MKIRGGKNIFLSVNLYFGFRNFLPNCVISDQIYQYTNVCKFKPKKGKICIITRNTCKNLCIIYDIKENRGPPANIWDSFACLLDFYLYEHGFSLDISKCYLRILVEKLTSMLRGSHQHDCDDHIQL